MKNTIFTGAGVAIVTPMNDDLSINFEKLGELIDFNIDNGTDAIIICGTTGESSTMTDEEHKACIKFAIERTNKRVPVIAGTGSNDTRYAIELSTEAEALGADGLLVVTPYYNKTSQAGLIAHFNAVADSVNIPIILYNIPGRTGMNISIDTYVELAKHKNIVAVKEASGNISYCAQIAQACGDSLDIYSGNDDQIIPIMALGGKGVISVLSNCMPKEAHLICQYCLDNDFVSARKLAISLLDFANNLFIDVNPIPVKEALNLMGMNVGPIRMPLVPLSDKARNTLIDSMKKINLV